MSRLSQKYHRRAAVRASEHSDRRHHGATAAQKTSAAGGPRSARQRDLPARPRVTAGSLSGPRLQGPPPLPAPVRHLLCGLLCAASRAWAAVTPTDSIEQAVQLMRSKAIRRLPVVEGGQPVGIVSLGDLAVERDPGSALGDISAVPPKTYPVAGLPPGTAARRRQR